MDSLTASSQNNVVKWHFQGPISHLSVINERLCLNKKTSLKESNTCETNTGTWDILVSNLGANQDDHLVYKVIPEFISITNSKNHLTDLNKRVSALLSAGVIKEKVEISQQEENNKQLRSLIIQAVVFFLINLLLMSGWQFRDS